MNTVASTQKAFSWVRYAKLCAIFCGLLVVMFASMYLIDRQYWMASVVIFGAGMAFLEYCTGKKVDPPSEALPPEVRNEVWRSRRNTRFDEVLGMGIFPMMLFALALPHDDHPIKWVPASLLFAVYTGLMLRVLADRARK